MSMAVGYEQEITFKDIGITYQTKSGFNDEQHLVTQVVFVDT